MVKPIKTTCPYCGVGCGVLASVDKQGVLSVQGDPDHPANFGRLCSKGSALAETVDHQGRMLHPSIDNKTVDWSTAIHHVAQRLQKIIDEHGRDAVAFYVSGQLLTEDYYVTNKLMKGYIGSANIDTNSRLCMSSPVAAHKRAFGSDTVPCCYEDLERAKLLVLAGSNTAWCHPVLFQRIVTAKKHNPDLTIVVIDPRLTATCDIADLHLPLRPGSDAILFNGLLNYLHQNNETNSFYINQCVDGVDEALASAAASTVSTTVVAEACQLDEALVAEFYRLFARTERVVTVFSQGVNQSSSGTDKVNAIINCHLLTGRIGRPGMGPFSFTGQPNAMGGREVGGLANQLAAHMAIENAQHRDTVKRFWQSPVIAEKEGLKAVDLFAAVGRGEIKALWIMGTNPVVSMPDADSVREALKACEMVVVSDCMQETDTTLLADVLLPAQTWAEKDGMVTNSERRISRQRSSLSAPGDARPDWWIVCQVAQAMGFNDGFSYASAAEIFREHAALSGFENNGQRDFDISVLSTLNDAAYADFQPLQWPLFIDNQSKEITGTPRMFSEGRFFTRNGRAQLIAITPRLPEVSTDETFPLILNTGRVRDQWHTMTRTGKAPHLSEHSPEPFVSIHPSDAARYSVVDGALARVFSRRGEVIVRARVCDTQQTGSVFVPMHWNDQFSSAGRVDALVNPLVDPISGQPEFKQTPVRLSPYQPVWHGFLLSRRKLNMHDIAYWVKATGKDFYRYELAGEQAAQDWSDWSREMLCQSQHDISWVEYLDEATQRYRGVRLVGDRVESCIFIAPTHQLPPRSWLSGLFERQALSEQERASLLSGQPGAGIKDSGAIVCACGNVGLNTITDAIRDQGLNSVEALGDALKAGTNCGSCVPELRVLLKQFQ